VDLRAQLQSTFGSAFTIERELTGGGMSRVFLADETALGRKVVVKILPAEMAGQVLIDRFRREIRVTASLQQANIVPVLFAGEVDGVPFYTMPFVKGESLRTRLTGHNPVPIAECVAILRDVAKALAYAHTEGIVHRDIKPENILLSGGTAVVTDFGIAKAVAAAHSDSGTTLTQVGLTLGTPAYMAPEQAFGERNIDHRADLYSLGIVAYELLVGTPPFTGGSVQALLGAHATQEPEPVDHRRHDIPAGLAALVMRCLAKDPERRPQRAEEVLQALETQSTPALAVVAARERPTIIVLPLVNMNANPDDEYFSDGMTEDIIAHLSLVRGLRVISRTTAMRYKGVKRPLADIAEELHASHVVEGSVRRAGARLRIVAQLIDPRSDEHLWAETFDRDLTDVFAIQSDVAERITGALQTRLSPDERLRFGRRPTEDLEAYNLYLLARQQNQAKPGGLAKAIEYFERAIERDPRFARAYGALAIAYGWYGAGYYGMRPRDAYGKANALASRALELDPDIAEAHVILGKFEEWIGYNWKAAEARFERALALNPSYAWGHIVYGFHLASVGRFAEAIEAGQRAVELDPAAPAVRDNSMWFHYWARRYDEALAGIVAAESQLPEDVYVLWPHGAILIALGRASDALTPLRELVKRAPIMSYSVLLAWGLAAAGQTTEARELLREIHSRESTEYVWPVGIAWAYARLGEMDRAFEYLERGYEDRAGFMNFIACEPAFDPFHGDPRFDSMVRRVGAIAPNSAGSTPAV
jgi:serine/threonine protein kinase/tetratricopeptide (TPR) repeat protein